MEDLTTQQELIRDSKYFTLDTITLSQAHQSTATVWEGLHTFLTTLNTISSVVAGASALSAYNELKTIIVTASATAAVLSALLSTYEPTKRAKLHKAAGFAFETMSNEFYDFYIKNSNNLQKISINDLSSSLRELKDKWISVKQKYRNESGDPNWVFMNILEILPNCQNMVRWKKTRRIMKLPDGNWEKEWDDLRRRA